MIESHPPPSPRELRIRGITKEDFDYIVSVLDRWAGGPSGAHAHPVFFHELGEQALVADRRGELVGFLLGFVAPGRPPTGYVHFVGIHPDARREGVAKELYRQFTERCQSAGARRMKAIAYIGDDVSARFHEALGFHTREDPEYAGPGRGRLVFTKDL